MIRTSNAKGTRYKLKLFKNGAIVLDTDSGKIGRFLNLTRTRKWDKAYIKVTYRPDVYNDGEYTSQKDLEKAFSDFVDSSLIEYAHSKQWN